MLVLAKFLIPSDYGNLNLFNTFVTFINIVIALSTTSFVSISFFQKSREELRQVVLITLLTATIGLFVFTILVVLFFPQLEGLVGLNLKFLLIGLLISYFMVYNSINLDIWRLEENPVGYGIYSLSFAICNFIISIYLIVNLQLGWAGRAYAWLMVTIIYFIVSTIFLIKKKYVTITIPKLGLIKETFLYALPLIPHTCSFWLKQGVDRYIINYYYSQAAVGYFSFAMNLAAIIVVIGTAFNSTNSVFIFKNLNEGYETVKYKLRKQNTLVFFTFIAVTLLVCIGAYLLIVLFMENYIPSIRFLLPLCISGFFQCIYLLWVNYLFFYKKTLDLMKITFSSAVLQVVLSLWLTRYGIMYTACISMLITGLTALLVYLKAKRITKHDGFKHA